MIYLYNGKKIVSVVLVDWIIIDLVCIKINFVVNIVRI